MKGETTKLEVLMRDLHEHVAGFFAKHGECGSPAWMLQDADGKITVMVTPIDGATKNLLPMAVRKLLKEHQAVRYAAAMEIWLDPEHREDAVMMSGEERDTAEKRLVLYRIDRSRSKPRLKPPETAELAAGRFSGLFEDA